MGNTPSAGTQTLVVVGQGCGRENDESREFIREDSRDSSFFLFLADR